MGMYNVIMSFIDMFVWRHAIIMYIYILCTCVGQYRNVPAAVTRTLLYSKFTMALVPSSYSQDTHQEIPWCELLDATILIITDNLLARV